MIQTVKHLNTSGRNFKEKIQSPRAKTGIGVKSVRNINSTLTLIAPNMATICSHTAAQLNRHPDSIHNRHLHRLRGGRFNEHQIELSDVSPDASSPNDNLVGSFKALTSIRL